jgi:hypothetical protein
VSVSIILCGGGYARSLEDWPAIRDQVFADLGASLVEGSVRLSDGNWFNFSDASLATENPGAGCQVGTSALRINRPLCRLLFELAERTRLFILFADAPSFLRPPALHGAHLDLGGLDIPIIDIDSGEALFLYLAGSDGEG